VTTTAPTFYERIGGADGVRALVRRFYAAMDALPAGKAARAVHPADLANAEERLYLFLSGWLGGPPLYVEQHGHPRLRARHLPFPIGDAERDAWMACMDEALRQAPLDDDARAKLRGGFANLADHMRNRG
jgi:hemoglobin